MTRHTITVPALASWPSGVTDAVLLVTAGIRSSVPGDRVVVVVGDPPSEPDRRGALLLALRSLVHASVLERPGVRINLVFGGTAQDRERTLEYVAGATYLHGATLDLSTAGSRL